MRGAVTHGRQVVAAIQHGLRTDVELDGYAVPAKTTKLPRKLKKACLRRVTLDTLAKCRQDKIRVTKFNARQRKRIWSRVVRRCRDDLLKQQERLRERDHRLDVAHKAALGEIMDQEDRKFLRLAHAICGDPREVRVPLRQLPAPV